MKVLIVEDETAATVNLMSLLARECPGCEVITTLETVTDTVEWFRTHPAPDVVFMDIHLADGDAFRIFERADIHCPIIFTTAYDQYALEAFKVNSIDYLLKPIKSEDLSRALDKLQHLTNADREGYVSRVSEMAEQSRSTFLIHVRDKIIPLRAEDIAYCYTSDEKVTIRTHDGRDFPYDKSLEVMISQLPDSDFFRANRQFIVSRRAIADISVWFGSRLAVNMTVATPERIVISKARVPEFKRWIAAG